MTIEGKTYGSYGLINEAEMKNPNIQYEIVTGNVIWAVLLCETVVAPIYFVGWDLYEPVGKKPEDFVPSQIK